MNLELFTESVQNEFIGEYSEVYRQIYSACQVKHPVLILGESGTGKDIVARLLHKNSQRYNQKLVAVNCALIPKEHLYGELFGIAKRAFTGVDDRKGQVAAANGGTLFLDEIGDLPGDAQAGLLRLLENQEVVRLGQDVSTTNPEKVDVRLIAATNKNINVLPDFRKDLLFRLKVIPIKLLPLRMQPRVILSLLRRFCESDSVRYIDFYLYAFCTWHHWPGNVRQLKHFCEYVRTMSEGDTLRLEPAASYFFEDEECLATPSHIVDYYRRIRPDIEVSEGGGTAEHLDECISGEENAALLHFFRQLMLMQESVTLTRLQTSGVAEVKKMRGLNWRTNAMEKYRGVFYKPIRLSAIPKDVDGDFLFFQPGEQDDAEIGRLRRVSDYVTNQWQRDPTRQVASNQSDIADLPTSESYSIALSQFQQEFFHRIFARYPTASNRAIGRITGISDKTIAERRKQYVKH